jgi:predicted nuclease with TOPRIM domain
MRSFVGDAANDRRSISQQYYEIANALSPTALRLREVENPTSVERVQSAIEGLEPEKVALNEIVDKTENELRKLRQVSKTATPEQREAIASVRRALQSSVIRQKNLLDKASGSE